MRSAISPEGRPKRKEGRYAHAAYAGHYLGCPFSPFRMKTTAQLLKILNEQRIAHAIFASSWLLQILKIADASILNSSSITAFYFLYSFRKYLLHCITNKWQVGVSVAYRLHRSLRYHWPIRKKIFNPNYEKQPVTPFHENKIHSAFISWAL